MKNNTRQIWLSHLEEITFPVLNALSLNQLKSTFPLAFHSERSIFAPLEAFARTLYGISAWIELENVYGEEKNLQQKYRKLALQCIDNATDPAAKDYMCFGPNQPQALVDAAFLSHALLIAPNQLMAPLSTKTKSNLISALKLTRTVVPPECNWYLFSAMVETVLYKLGETDWDFNVIKRAVDKHMDWYKGDGIYGDGPEFHFDYYNSFVIHPMLVDIVKTFEETSEFKHVFDAVMTRASRYSTILYNMISPDGFYPLTGRSICYRFGAFHLLSQASLQGFLDESVTKNEVRSALTKVIEQTMNSEIFNEKGWLIPGVYGYQPSLAEHYINVGSLYLCCFVFTPLGLPEDDLFWAGPDVKWRSQKIYDAEDVSKDEYLS